MVVVMLLEVVLMAGAADPSLLARLAQVDTRLDELYETAEYRVLTHVDQLDANGQVIKTSDAETRMFTREDGRPWEEIVRFEEGGKDLTAEHQRKREKLLQGGRTREEDFPFRSPFATTEQPRYRFQDLGPVEGAPGEERIAFEPLEKAQDAYAGEAEVELDIPAVRRIAFHPTAFPYFVHRTDVEIRFDAQTPAGPALSHMSVEGEGGALWVKKHMRLTTEVPGYTLPAPPAVAASATATATPPSSQVVPEPTPAGSHALAPR